MFLPALEPGQSKMPRLARAHFWWPCSPVSSRGGGGKGALWGLFKKGTSPIHEGSPRRPADRSPRAVSWGLKYEFWVNTSDGKYTRVGHEYTRVGHEYTHTGHEYTHTGHSR